MSRTARLPRRVLVPTALSLLAAARLALSGCAAGQYSQTADQVAAIDGANGTVGDIAVLNARLAPTEREKYTAGSDARLLLWISNDGHHRRRHADVSTSPAADEITIRGDATVPAQYLADFATLRHRGDRHRLHRRRSYGQSIPMTFSFASAGSVTLNIPIQVPDERSTDRPTIEILPPHPTPIWEEGHGDEAAAAEEGGEG